MKICAIILLMLVALTTSLSAQTPGAVQLRLLDCEMDYAGLTASRVGPESPKIKSLKTEIDAISAMPGIRDAKYWEYVKERKQMLEANLAKETAEGKGAEHPSVLGTKAQLAAIDVIEKNRDSAAETP